MSASVNKTTIDIFFELMRAGLWERDVWLSGFCNINYADLYQIAEEQSVVGLLTVGLEHVTDIKTPQEWSLKFIGATLQIERQNKAMNLFLNRLLDGFRKEKIYCLLVKGQGIAPCYERPLWRVCGDVDLFLNGENDVKARDYLIPMASSIENEEKYKKHLGLTIDNWVVELHGNLYSSLSRKVEKELDDVYADTFDRGVVKSGDIAGVQVFLLGNENNVFYVFTHILQHYFHGGIGLRQICDWCRLLWTFRGQLDQNVLRKRIEYAGLMTEWKSFAYLAVEYLGMPPMAMPFYDISAKWRKKARQIKTYIMKTGNFGQRDLGYVRKYGYFKRKICSFKSTMFDMFIHLRVFPVDTIRFFMYYTCIRLNALRRGE